MKKVVFMEVRPEEKIRIESVIKDVPEFKDVNVHFAPDALNADTVGMVKDAEIVSTFIKSEVRKDVIDLLPNLKFLATRSTGFDHIDAAYAASRGIKTANVPAYGSRTVAEFAFALILGLSRKTFAANLQVKTGGGAEIGDFMGFDLQGKTIGVVGTGRIGINAIQIAKGFDMNVLAFDAFTNNEQADKLGFKYVPLDELLSRSDIVTLHVPYNKDTHYLINTENISKFKKGALLINTARGEVCDTEAIINGLDEGILSGVGLDVIEGEKHAKKLGPIFNELLARPNVFITPHMAFFSREAQHEIHVTTIENIAAYLRGQEKNLVKI